MFSRYCSSNTTEGALFWTDTVKVPQVIFFSPAVFKYPELGDLYREGDRVLHVTTGLGGVIPVRFGVTPEIVVITLRKK